MERQADNRNQQGRTTPGPCIPTRCFVQATNGRRSLVAETGQEPGELTRKRALITPVRAIRAETAENVAGRFCTVS